MTQQAWADYVTEDYFICHHCQKKGDGVEYVELSFKSNGNTKRRIVDRNTISSIGELIKESKYGAQVNSGVASFGQINA